MKLIILEIASATVHNLGYLYSFNVSLNHLQQVIEMLDLFIFIYFFFGGGGSAAILVISFVNHVF